MKLIDLIILCITRKDVRSVTFFTTPKFVLTLDQEQEFLEIVSFETNFYSYWMYFISHDHPLNSVPP